MRRCGRSVVATAARPPAVPDLRVIQPRIVRSRILRGPQPQTSLVAIFPFQGDGSRRSPPPVGFRFIVPLAAVALSPFRQPWVRSCGVA
jgi:hypothetical protein